MTIAQMLEQSGILTLLGMCVVFAFLIIMIGAMNLLHGVIHLFGLDKAEPPAASAASTTIGTAALISFDWLRTLAVFVSVRRV